MADRSKKLIHDKVVELASFLGKDASGLRNDEQIPAAGLDSAAIIELILWIEGTFDITIPQEDLTIENLGTIDAIHSYLERSGAAIS